MNYMDRGTINTGYFSSALFNRNYMARGAVNSEYFSSALFNRNYMARGAINSEYFSSVLSNRSYMTRGAINSEYFSSALSNRSYMARGDCNKWHSINTSEVSRTEGSAKQRTPEPGDLPLGAPTRGWPEQHTAAALSPLFSTHRQ